MVMRKSLLNIVTQQCQTNRAASIQPDILRDTGLGEACSDPSPEPFVFEFVWTIAKTAKDFLESVAEAGRLRER